jgi:hypothetical protein
MKTDNITIDAVLDRDLLKIIKDYELFDKFQSKALRCPKCDRIINFENIGALIVNNESITIYCDDNICLSELIGEE